MDFTKNADKQGCMGIHGVSYNQVIDVDNGISAEVVTLSEQKVYMKMDDVTADDALITVLLKAAVAMVERYTNTNLTQRTVVAILNNINGGSYLPYGPVSGTPTGEDIDGNTIGVTIMGTKWKQLRIPVTDYVQVSYTGGFATVPEEYRDAVKAQCLFLYENRGDGTTAISPLAQDILNPLRRV